MAGKSRERGPAYEVYCRECDWQVDGAVELKGQANLLAGRHISQTGHVVALKAIEGSPEDADADDFYRGGGRSVHFEVLRPATGAAEAVERHRCGPVDWVVESG